MSCKVEINGYVKRPASKTSKGGKTYNQFQVCSKTGKKADGKAQYTYFNCRDFSGGPLPADDSYVVVRGSMSVSTAEKDGKTYTNFDVFVDSLENPDGKTESAPKAPDTERDPWE